MIHKAEYTKRWQTYFDAYNGDYFKDEAIEFAFKKKKA